MEHARTLEVRVDGGVGLLTLDRPSKLNAISADMVAELTVAAAWFDGQPDVRVVLLSGAGRMFSAGADLDEFRDRFADTEGGGDRSAGAREEALTGAAMTDTIASMRAVTIAAVHGVAVGGAAALVAACDLRIMADDARLLVPELAMGIPLAWGAVPRLVSDLGPAVVRDLLLTGRPLEAAEAVARGFAIAHHPADDLPKQARALADLVASRPAYGTQVVNARVRALAAARAAAALDDEAASLAHALTEDEVVAAGRAYLGSLDAPPPTH